MSGARKAARLDFLGRAGWERASIRGLAGDASARSYFRLSEGRNLAILMDADPATGEATMPFVTMTRYLRGLGLSAPTVMAHDTDLGFLLLEDLGDALFARVAEADPGMEGPLAEAAAELLAHLQSHPPATGLVVADTRHLIDILDPFFTEYLTSRNHTAGSGFRAELETEFAKVLDAHAGPASVTVLRDFHAENLIWLPERDGVARCGLLDYQDAVIGPAAYDLASFVQDARRDVSEQAATHMIATFARLTDTPAEDVSAAVAVLGVQRNLRILGIFHRLARVRNKASYLTLVPRVEAHIRSGLAHPVMSPVSEILSPVFDDA